MILSSVCPTKLILLTTYDFELCFVSVFLLTYITDQGVESAVLLGHEDSVWELAYSSNLKRLASCSADGTVRIWDPQSSTPCIAVFNKEKGECVIPGSLLSNIL